MMSTAFPLPQVSIVIPMLNEERHIEDCVQSLLGQDYPRERLDIVVVDGGSTDRSLEIVRALASRDPRVRLVGGPGLNCPTALNRGIGVARGDVVCKVDAHGYVAPDFVRVAVQRLKGDDALMCVGGPIRPVARSLIARSNSLARASRFGVGRGVNTLASHDQLVETVQCGAYRRSVFDEVGGFDENLQFGEDEEMNWRIIQAGYRILFTPAMHFYYFPRQSFRSFFLQYYRYGRVRLRVVMKHPRFLSLKHLVPSAFVVSVVVVLAAIPLCPLGKPLFLALLLVYALGSLIASIAIASREGPALLLTLPVSFACLHFGYGLGWLSGWRECWSERRARRSRANIVQ